MGNFKFVRDNVEQYKSHKWLLVSSLQKAIRRGRIEEAGTLWDVTKEIDKFYAMYRTSIVAIEDVGLGNPLLVHDFLSTSLKKANLAAKGGDEYVRDVILKLAASVKDRTACDATWLAGKITPETMDEDALQACYLNSSEDLVNRCLAAWALTGNKKIKHEGIKGRDDVSDIERFAQLSEKLGADKSAIEVALASYPYHKEPQLFAYPLLSAILKEEAGKKLGQFTTGDTFNKSLDVKIYDFNGIPILLSAVDGHTSEGKRVLERVKQLPEIHQYIQDLSEESQAYVLKHVMFRIEGGQVDKRLFYPTASKIHKQAQAFIDDDHIDLPSLMKTMSDLMPEIDEMRVQSLNQTFKRTPKRGM